MKKDYKKYLDELLEVLVSIKDKSDMYEFLQSVLTRAELDIVPKRVQIVKMLKEGLPQREIAQKLGMGIATVTRGANELKRGRFKNIS